MRPCTVLIAILCAAGALLVVAGCASLDEGYSTHYGLTSTEPPSARENPGEEGYGSGFVGIQEIEEYEETYQKKDIMKKDEPTEPSEE